MSMSWCPKCQKITEQTIEETKILKQQTCDKCNTLLYRIWKPVKKESKKI